MKKSYLICLFFLVTTFSCEKNDKSFNLSIEGVWLQDSGIIEGTDMSYRNVLKLDSDGTYERSLQIIETKDEQNLIGYLSLSIGEYQVENSKLQLMRIEQYGLDNDSQYLDREDLILEDKIDELPEIEFKIDKAKNTLTLYYNCQDNALCIPFQTFYRRN